jgi:uncharacterized membrane protein YkvA (DUF1232 family)
MECILLLDRPMSIREWASAMKRDSVAVYLAARDPRVPWYAKALGILVAAYAFSPIDLIPDFIPVLGYVDDLILVPLGVMLARRLIPPAIFAEHREAAARLVERPVSRVAAAVIILAWMIAIALTTWLGWRMYRSRGRR